MQRYIVTVGVVADRGAITVITPDAKMKTHSIRSDIAKWQDSAHVRSLVENFMLFKYPEVVGKMHGSTEQYAHHTALSSLYTFYVEVDSEPLTPAEDAIVRVLTDRLAWFTTREVHLKRCELQQVEPDGESQQETGELLQKLYIEGKLHKGGLDTGALAWKLAWK